MAPPSVRAARWIVVVHVVLYALWTICCHLTVIGRGTGTELFRTSIVAASLVTLGLVVVLFARPLARTRARIDADVCADLPAPSGPTPTLVLRLSALVGAGIALACWAALHNALWVWLAAVVLVFAAAIWELSHIRTTTWTAPVDAPEPRWHAPLLFLASIASGYLAMCVSRSNTDDAHYVNTAVALADRPDFPLYLRDTIHDAGILMIPAYRVHSYELLGGALSFLTGLDAIWIIHVALAGLAGALLPLAWAMLLRELDPQRWLAMLAVVIGWFLFDGDDYHSPSMHAYARLFQGKAVMYAVGVPALATLGLRFGRAPNATGFVLLVLAQVGLVGLSSTGIWLAPVVAVTSVLCTLRWERRYLRVAALALGSTAYAIGMGLWVKSQSVGTVASEVVAGSLSAANEGSLGRLADVFYVSLSGWPQAFLYSTVLLLSIGLAQTPLMRRYLVAFLLVFGLVLANPILADVVQRSLVGRSTYKRILWILPLGASLGVVFTAAWREHAAPRARAAAFALGLALFSAFFTLSPKTTLFAHALVRTTPSLKVDVGAMEAARIVTAAMPGRGHVLAAGQVAMTLPMVHRHPYPIVVKPKWFPSGTDGPRRFRLRRIVDRETKPILGKRQLWLRQELDHYRIDGLVLTRQAATTPGLTDALRTFGFAREDAPVRYEIWTRPRSHTKRPPSEQPRAP